MQYFVALFVLLFSLKAFGLELQGLHISATGNNKYEAEIKAHTDGKRRALTLVANSIGISNASFSQVPYLELKSVFILKEKISATPLEESYSADVTYAYDLLEVSKLIQKYASAEVKEQYFKYIVIPVFKQKNQISFMDGKSAWLDAWIAQKEICEQYKMLPIDPSKSTGITAGNIYNLTYGDFLSMLPMKRFEKVLIVSCEYFTKEDGNMFFSVITTDISDSAKGVTDIRYDINSPTMDKKNFKEAIDHIVVKYGENARTKLHLSDKATDVKFESERSIIKSAKAKDAGSVLDTGLVAEYTVHLNEIVMRADIFSQEGLESFKQKLSQIPAIVKYKINIDKVNHYLVTLYTDKTMQEIAEGFYEHNLSYRENGAELVAFELETGI